MLKAIITVFFTAMLFLVVARLAAIKCGLVDIPAGRKQHKGAVPLAGGISLYCAIVVFYLFWPEALPHTQAHFLPYLEGISLLLFMGITDDRFDLPVAPRVCIQALSAVIIMTDGFCLRTFGHILGNTELVTGPAGYLLTVLATWAAINAFNMVDGVDGLLGTLALVTFAALMVIFLLAGARTRGMWCLLMMVALLPYLMFNMGWLVSPRLKVFMGDAGSMVTGFTLFWLILLGSQGDEAVMAPVTALWVIALPLMDMVTMMVRRLRRRQSPFYPDRDHLHHILLRAGFTGHQTVVVMALLATAFAGTGIILSLLGVAEWLSLLAFLGLFSLYFLLNTRAQKCHPDPGEKRTFPPSPAGECRN